MRFFLLILFVVLVACDDQNTNTDTTGGNVVVAGMNTAGIVTIAGTPAGSTAGTAGTAGTPAGNTSGTPAGAGTPAGSTTTCQTTSCQAGSCTISCSCPDVEGMVSFDACVDGCCITTTDEACADLCANMPPPVCEYGETSCVEGAPSAIQTCNIMRQWQIQGCPEGQSCFSGQCLDDGCQEGQTTCLGRDQILNCQNGQWTSGQLCNESCVDGRCVSAACARAEMEKSYLGCEYLAVELPNLAFDSIGGTTIDSPIAIILSNPSADLSATVNLFAPNQQISNLVPTIEVSASLATMYQGPLQTVKSNIKSADGQIIQDEIDRGENLVIPPKGIATLLLPRLRFQGLGSVVNRNAVRVVSDQPVSAYQFSPYCCNYSFSNDASLLIPTTALGNEYKFLGVPTWVSVDSALGGGGGSPSSMAIIANKDQTRVTVTLGANAEIEMDQQNRLQRAGNTWVATLDKQEVLLIKSTSRAGSLFGSVPQPDLTGSLIQADQPVSVFSNHECAFYPEALAACDHLEEQLFPTDTWGKDFNLVPVATRRENSTFERTYWKIIAQSPGTRILLSDTFSALNGAGPGYAGVPDCGQLLDADQKTIVMGNEGFCEFSTKKAFSMNADQNLMVMGIISGQESTGVLSSFGEHAGDPSIFLVPPARQYRNNYSFLTPETYFVDYVTVISSTSNQILLDGNPVDLSSATAISGSSQSFIHIPLAQDGPHRLEGTQPFGILVFAYDDFVSYAFTGGLNLTKR